MPRPISNANKLKEENNILANENKYMKFIINDTALFFDDNTYMDKEQLWEIINKWKKYILKDEDKNIQIQNI